MPAAMSLIKDALFMTLRHSHRSPWRCKAGLSRRRLSIQADPILPSQKEGSAGQTFVGPALRYFRHRVCLCGEVSPWLRPRLRLFGSCLRDTLTLARYPAHAGTRRDNGHWRCEHGPKPK